MNKIGMSRKVLFPLLAAGALAASSQALGAGLSYNLDTVISGDTPAGPAPWATVNYDVVDADSVLVQILNLATAPQALKTFVFNVEDPFLTGGLSISGISGAPILNPLDTVAFSVDSFHRPGGSWDAIVEFDSPAFLPGSGGMVSFIINRSDGLLPVSAFDSTTTLGYHAAAHLIRIPDVGTLGKDGSSWIVEENLGTQVPEPSTYAAIAAMGVIGGTSWYRARRKTAASTK